MFRVYADFHGHHKVMALVPDALPSIGLWVACGSWCSGQDADGFVPREVARRFDPTGRYAGRLVVVGLWHAASKDGEDGYRFHQWASHQRPDYRPRIPDSVRFAVYERDGHRCVQCGADSPLSLDHIWPWSLGGSDEFGNLQTLCISCNCRKGATVR